jgi:hypothetical protein
MRSRLETRLRALHRRPLDGQAAHERAHEAELVAAFTRRTGAAVPARARWLGLPRVALAGLVGAAVAVGACVMPAEYPMSLGYGFDLVLPVAQLEGLDLEAIARPLEDEPGVERIELRVEHRQVERAGPGGARVLEDEARVRLFVLGDDLDPDALRAELEAQSPVLAGIEMREIPLEGTVHGTLGGRLSHHLLDVTIDRHGVEEAERQVLAALVAQGVAPEDARVDITEERDADGQRRIEVRVEAEHREP